MDLSLTPAEIAARYAVVGETKAKKPTAILIVLGIVYIVETLSVIIQVGYFKLSGGKRIFKMAPFHHHLEMGGWLGHKWTEKQLFVLVVVVSTLAGLLSFMGITGRFIA